MTDSGWRVSLVYEKTFDLKLEQIWPDGGAPENPTEDDVLAVIEDCGGFMRILDEWGLTIEENDGARVMVWKRQEPVQKPEQWFDVDECIPPKTRDVVVISDGKNEHRAYAMGQEWYAPVNSMWLGTFGNYPKWRHKREGDPSW